MSTKLAVQKKEHIIADNDLDALVIEISHLTREAPLKLALDIGRLIIDRLYNGDLTRWRERDAKDASFRKLTEHSELPEGVNATSLYRSVAIYEMFTELEADVSTWQHLGASHIRAVLPLPERKLQKKFLDTANKKRWTVLELEAEVGKKREKTSRGGRHPLPQFIKSIRRLDKFVQDPDLLYVDLEAAQELNADEKADLLATVTGMLEQLATLAKALESESGD